MFDGFALEHVDVGEVRLRVRHGGSGPAVVLVHGHPRTHTTWHRVAAHLAPSHFVVCPDLRGYGQSSLPADAPDHAQSSKRAMAGDIAALMRQLGHEHFSVVGHDRGALVAFRTAVDHPDAGDRLVVMDGLPVVEHMERLNEAFVQADRAAGRRVVCPTLLLTATEDDIDIHGDPVAIWQPWIANELRSSPIHSGHHQERWASATKLPPESVAVIGAGRPLSHPDRTRAANGIQRMLVEIPFTEDEWAASRAATPPSSVSLISWLASQRQRDRRPQRRATHPVGLARWHPADVPWSPGLTRSRHALALHGGRTGAASRLAAHPRLGRRWRAALRPSGCP